jgi:hypothetical protein
MPSHQADPPPIRLALKAGGLFVILNLLFAAWNPPFARLSIYNILVPGRERFPFAFHPEEDYSVVYSDLDAMFASHRISKPKQPDELRVVLVGDSSVWGTLLQPDQTLSAQLTGVGLECGGRRLQFYDLGYHRSSLGKDLMILDRAMEYQPDMVLWLVSLYAFTPERRSGHALIPANLARAREIDAEYGVFPNLRAASPSDPLTARTAAGRKKDLALWFALEEYGLLWAATGIDQDIGGNPPPEEAPGRPDLSFAGWQPPALESSQLSLDLIDTGRALAGGVPVLLVNEPIQIDPADPERYNSFYPRWAYDRYREILAGESALRGWDFLDAWDLLAPQEFTNSPLHRSPAGEALFASTLSAHVQQRLCP